jgi:hypothetical protein
MARPRLELLARYAAVLFVEVVMLSFRRPGEVGRFRQRYRRLLHGIPRLRFAPLGMTERQL